MKKNIKNIFIFFLGFFVFFINTNFCLASFDSNILDSMPNSKNENDEKISVQKIASDSGYSNSSVAIILQRVIQIVLGLSGTIALILVIISGFLYLSSKGDPKKIQNSLKYMSTGFIGILLMTSAYALSGYIIKQIQRISGKTNEVVIDIPSQSDKERCSSYDNKESCDADLGCLFFNGCIAKNSLKGGTSCNLNEQCESNKCNNGYCSIPAQLQTNGCKLTSYDDSLAERYNKDSLKNNLDFIHSSLCKNGYTASSVGNADNSNCPENLSAIKYTCSGGEGISSNCYICLSKACSEAFPLSKCEEGPFSNCVIKPSSSGTNSCVEK